MDRPLLVMAAIIEKEGKYLVTQRLPGAHREFHWEFPGGKVEYGEDPRNALEREINEELGIKVIAKEIFEISSYVYSDANKHIVLLACHCDFVEGEIEKKEISDFKWLTPNEMKDYDFPEADLPFVKKLIKGL